MKYSSRIKSISYVKANAADLIRELTQKREPLVITQNGEAKAVMQDVASYDATQEMLALLKILALGRRQIRKARAFRLPRLRAGYARAAPGASALRGAAGARRARRPGGNPRLDRAE